jgi:hypothetical protein
MTRKKEMRILFERVVDLQYASREAAIRRVGREFTKGRVKNSISRLTRANEFTSVVRRLNNRAHHHLSRKLASRGKVASAREISGAVIQKTTLTLPAPLTAATHQSRRVAARTLKTASLRRIAHLRRVRLPLTTARVRAL